MENTKKVLLVDGSTVDDKLKLATRNLHYVNVLPSIVSDELNYFLKTIRRPSNEEQTNYYQIHEKSCTAYLLISMIHMNAGSECLQHTAA